MAIPLGTTQTLWRVDEDEYLFGPFARPNCVFRQDELGRYRWRSDDTWAVYSAQPDGTLTENNVFLSRDAAFRYCITLAQEEITDLQQCIDRWTAELENDPEVV